MDSTVVDSTVEILQESAEQSAEKVQTQMNDFVVFIQEHIPNFIEFGIRLLIAVLIFSVGRLLIKWIRKRIRNSLNRSSADAGLTQFTDSFLKISLYIVLLLIVAANLGIEISSISMLFASAGVGISLSLQQTLSNFAGGVLILLLKPFVVGDYIIEDTNKDEGTVKEIQTFYTKLTTVDNKTIVIPNGILANNSLTNVTAKAERQLDLRIGISYDSDLKKAKLLLEQMLKEIPSIMQDENLYVFVDSLGESSVVLGIRGWVKTDEYWTTRWDLLERIKLTFDEEGIVIPYNQLTVHLDEKAESGSHA